MEKNLLYFMLGNVDMAKVSTQQLLDISEDEKFKKSLMEDLAKYEKFYNKIIEVRDCDEDLKDVSPLAKFSAKTAITVKTLMDKTPHKMSEMLIDGFRMGIDDIEENLKKAKECGEKPEVIKLANEYKQLLLDTMDKYKEFL